MPQWWTFKPPTEADYDRPDFKAWFQGILNNTAAKNAEVQTKVHEHFLAMMDSARFLYGDDSNEVRYLRGKGEPQPTSTVAAAKKTWKRWEDHIAALQRAKDNAIAAERRAQKAEQKRLEREANEKRAQEEREARLEVQRAEDADYRRRKAEAIAEMEAHGLISGLDFDPNKAITTLRRYQRLWDGRDLDLEKSYRDYDA